MSRFAFVILFALANLCFFGSSYAQGIFQVGCLGIKKKKL